MYTWARVWQRFGSAMSAAISGSSLLIAQSQPTALTGLAGLASGIMGRYLKWLESRAVMLRWMLIRVQPAPPNAHKPAIPASNVPTATGAQIVGGCTHERAVQHYRDGVAVLLGPLVLGDVHSQVR